MSAFPPGSRGFLLTRKGGQGVRPYTWLYYQASIIRDLLCARSSRALRLRVGRVTDVSVLFPSYHGGSRQPK